MEPHRSAGWDNFSLPSGGRILAAPYFDDVNPGAGGSVGVFDGEGVRAITWQAVPYFGRTGTVTFQIAFHANGVIEVRYGDMATPPGGTADSGISVGTATIGLSRGSVAAVPSLGRIANKPDVAITNAGGILDATGLAVLDELPGNDVLLFTPDGSGNYTIIHNFGVSSTALGLGVHNEPEMLTLSGEVLTESTNSQEPVPPDAVTFVFDTAWFTALPDEVEFWRPADPRMDALQQIWHDEAPDATLLIVVGTVVYAPNDGLSREDDIDRLLSSPEGIDQLFDGAWEILSSVVDEELI